MSLANHGVAQADLHDARPPPPGKPESDRDATVRAHVRKVLRRLIRQVREESSETG
ncbi:hypothetical protein [Methylobacterium durans]|uniref:hypothetical protein n=1 Tax=Methylobacterium durans TaxID=2202825 RepID=UPI0013A54035|nr:hypothetical protein [Methylobacterium durans]